MLLFWMRIGRKESTKSRQEHREQSEQAQQEIKMHKSWKSMQGYDMMMTSLQTTTGHT